MERNEALAQEAVKYLSLAQRFEKEGHIEKAIEHYVVAADYLKSSGYLMQRIDEIYSRIEELKKFVKQEIFYRQEQSRAQVEQIQEQAFSLLDGAQKLESDGFFEDAIGQYMSAIRLLVQSGWTETQLKNLKSKITNLAGKLERQKIIQTQKEIESQQLETEPQVVGAFGKKKIKPSDIREATVVGNSVMHHIFLNIDPTYIGLSPYVPVIKRGLNLNSKDINLKISRGGKVYV
ncbi:unnamed protein product, partial [marine sediment metagenome]